MRQTYKVTKSKKLWHERNWKESNHIMTMAEVMQEIGSLVICGWRVVSRSIDHVSFEENIHPESPVSPMQIRIDIGESVVQS